MLTLTYQADSGTIPCMERNILHQLILRVSVTQPPGTLDPTRWDWPAQLGDITGLEAVELIDHVAIPAKRCANETCGRWFNLQAGRAEKSQYRKVGVLYCTDKCARAQAQREYRRRQRTTAFERKDHSA